MSLIPWFIAAVALGAAGFFAWKLTRLQRTDALQKAEADRLREGLLNVVDDAFLVLDARQCVIFTNPAADALLDQPTIGKTLAQVMPNPDLEALILDARMVRGEVVERRIEHERHILNVRALAFQNSDMFFEVLTLRDVTEIQRLERARREMVSNISHELNTPITTIGLLADTLLTTAIKEKPKRTKKMAADIRREVDTLTQLVQEMRDLSLIESGQMPVRLVPTDLQAIVSASVEPLLPLAESKGQAINLSVPDGINVLADDMQIQRAIKNIVHNAVKFSPENEQIDVVASIDPAHDEVVIAVKDRGPGIPADDLPRIFERFFQVDRARGHGTGLGLAIVRHIVVAHGGRTWAENVEGQGATFFMTLALAESIHNAQAVI